MPDAFPKIHLPPATPLAEAAPRLARAPRQELLAEQLRRCKYVDLVIPGPAVVGSESSPAAPVTLRVLVLDNEYGADSITLPEGGGGGSGIGRYIHFTWTGAATNNITGALLREDIEAAYAAISSAPAEGDLLISNYFHYIVVDRVKVLNSLPALGTNGNFLRVRLTSGDPELFALQIGPNTLLP